jgi:hypothetical protein
MKHLILLSLLATLVALACAEDSKDEADAGPDLDSDVDTDTDSDSDTGEGLTYQDLCDEIQSLCEGINIEAVQSCLDDLEPCSEFFQDMYNVDTLADCFDAFELCNELIECVQQATIDPTPCEESAVDCPAFVDLVENEDDVYAALAGHWPCWTAMGIDIQADVVNIWIVARGECVPAQEIYDTLCP